ncbi:MAG: zinc ribbon domain-containing protein [Verrucomicrobiota bacterium]|nr:zinc ribbon domain-containing protein [Verrucomicrobiota bacterium]
MPIYEYQSSDRSKSCDYCRDGFDLLRKLSDPAPAACPRCGASVTKLISAHSVGFSRSGLDQRAQNAGFTKLKRLGKGEYEKKF